MFRFQKFLNEYISIFEITPSEMDRSNKSIFFARISADSHSSDLDVRDNFCNLIKMFHYQKAS